MSGRPELTPDLALAAALLYVVAADGHLTMAERLVLAKLVPSDRLIERALAYCRTTPSAEFLAACVARFDADERLCLLLNMIDAAMADGDVAEEERELLSKVQDVFGIGDDELAPHLRTLSLKNDRRRFRA